MRSSRRPRRGQALVEFAVILPTFLLVLLGIMEFGFVFAHYVTMEYATREGARMGAGLANGSATFGCHEVDEQVVAAAQRVLTARGSQVDAGRVDEIRIYKADASGGEEGPVNVWVPGKGPKVDGEQLLFKLQSSGWDACTRSNDGLGSTDSLGVSMVYRYRYVTPLGNVLGLTGSPSLTMSDQTVMALNP